MTEVDYTETHGRGIAISTSRQGIDHVMEGEVAHVEMRNDGYLNVHFRDDDAPGGGYVSCSVHTFRYLEG